MGSLQRATCFALVHAEHGFNFPNWEYVLETFFPFSKIYFATSMHAMLFIISFLEYFYIETACILMYMKRHI